MALPVAEFARRSLLRVIANHTEVVILRDQDPNDKSSDPRQVKASPAGLLNMRLADLGLTNQAQVEILRVDLKNELPLIDGELTMAKISPGTVLSKLKDFLAAALDMKL
jgi:hypothetical protein